MGRGQCSGEPLAPGPDLVGRTQVLPVPCQAAAWTPSMRNFPDEDIWQFQAIRLSSSNLHGPEPRAGLSARTVQLSTHPWSKLARQSTVTGLPFPFCSSRGPTCPMLLALGPLA